MHTCLRYKLCLMCNVANHSNRFSSDCDHVTFLKLPLKAWFPCDVNVATDHRECGVIKEWNQSRHTKIKFLVSETLQKKVTLIVSNCILLLVYRCLSRPSLSVYIIHMTWLVTSYFYLKKSLSTEDCFSGFL